MQEENLVQSVARSFILLETILKHGALGISELSRLSGLHKATVFRLLSTLCSLGYITKNEQTEKYSPTLKVVSLSAQVLEHIDIRSLVRPILEGLSKECGEAVHFVKREGDEIVYIDKIGSNSTSIQMASRIGIRLPLCCTAVGKAMLAHASNDEVCRIFKEQSLIKRTEYTIVELDKFLRELELTRKRGYAIDNEENELGVRCIAVAIAGPFKKYDYAFSISAPISRMPDNRLEELAEAVLNAKKGIV